MKALRRPTLTVLFLLLSLLAFSKQKMTDTVLYVPVERSDLYVRLAGNAGGPLLINLHGGPGAFSGFDHHFNKNHLEDRYLIAYLDQRGGGKSEICTDSTMLNMQQFVDDLNVVVDTLKIRYPNRKVNLIGSSWGGTLGLLYMIEHQNEINSFICVSGKADGMYPIRALIEHERKLAGEDPVHHKEILDKLSEIEKSDFTHFFNDMNLLKHQFPKELGFNVYWANKTAQMKAVELGKDPEYYQEARYTKEEFQEALNKMEFVNRVFRNTYAYNNLNIIDEIAVIKRPVLVIQGQDDYAIGPNQAHMIYDALSGIPGHDKELKIIPGAAHNLNMESERLYFEAVNSFLHKENGV